MTLGPQDPSAFSRLLNHMVDTRIPFRMSIKIGGGGLDSQALRKLAASLLAITNSENKLIKQSIEALQSKAHIEPIVKFRASFAT